MPQPLVMQFGPWVPDGADIAFQPPSNGPINIPLSDCLNVYWANSTYLNLPSLATFGNFSALPAQCLGAFTAIDTNGIPRVYAGTGSDLYQWNGLTWVQVSKSTGAYSGTVYWSFAEFGGCICAVNGVSPLQDMPIGGSTFADIPAAPIGKVTGVINQSLFIGDIAGTPYRVQWSAIGDSTQWPTPLTDAAIAAQSGFQDLTQDWGNVMFIGSGPQFGVIFQRNGITRATYVGGDVVFSFVPFERRRGLIARGAAVQHSEMTFFISDDGFHITDGSQVDNIGRSDDGSLGVDQFFWSNVNKAAVSNISSGYDADKKSIFWAIPTGFNTLPDTLLTFNPSSKRWTKSAIASEFVFTDNDGSRHQLGVMDRSHRYNSLTGPPQSGFLETYDINFNDQRVRFVTGVKPHIDFALLTDSSGNPITNTGGSPLVGDRPTCRAGAHNSESDAVVYTADAEPDAFSKIAPALATGSLFRARVTAGASPKIPGATIYTETGGGV
jgi:hypothetical protein